MDLVREVELGGAVRAGDDGALLWWAVSRPTVSVRFSRPASSTFAGILAGVRAVADRDRLLGHAHAQHAGLHASAAASAAIIGQVVALPTTMSLLRGGDDHQRDGDHLRPGDLGSALVGKFSSPVVVAISMFTVVVATIAVNIAANVVSPANGFANAFRGSSAPRPAGSSPA
jgi:hypothetical protein